jgi:hypothetical protein
MNVVDCSWINCCGQQRYFCQYQLQRHHQGSEIRAKYSIQLISNAICNRLAILKRKRSKEKRLYCISYNKMHTKTPTVERYVAADKSFTTLHPYQTNIDLNKCFAFRGRHRSLSQINKVIQQGVV